MLMGKLVDMSDFQGETIYPPPFLPFLAKRMGVGVYTVYLEAPRGRNFLLPSFFAHPPLEGYLGG